MLSAIIGGATALGGAIYGGIKSSQLNKKAEEAEAKQRAENKAWYNTKMSQDYTQRADVQAAIKRQRELLDEQYSRARATNVVAGGTDEALALQQKAANQSLSNTMTDVAAQGAAYKDNVEAQYRAQDAAINQQQIARYQQQAANAANAAAQVVNAGTNMVGNDLAADTSKIAAKNAATNTAGKTALPAGLQFAPLGQVTQNKKPKIVEV